MNKFRLTDEELMDFPKNCAPFNHKGAVIVNKEILSSLCRELLEFRARDNEEKSNLLEIFHLINDSRMEKFQFSDYRLGEIVRDFTDLFDPKKVKGSVKFKV
jgi:hypothetical protein